MRYLSFITLSITSLLLFSCGNSSQDEAKDLTDQIKEPVRTSSPGSVATTESEYYMKAKIDGKQWIASHMMPDEDENSSYIRIHGENGEDYMNFQLWKRGIELGKTFPFDEDDASNLSLEGDPSFWSGKSGGIKITKLDGKWLEGKFAYKATSSGSAKSVDVTEGFFQGAFRGGGESIITSCGLCCYEISPRWRIEA